MQVESFPPIADTGATRLILGSMPGVASLAAQRYYAHPQNAFWRIMGELLGFAADAPYPKRVSALKRAGIAVWDVLQACERAGSLDTSIRRDSEVANDFAAFFAEHSRITHIFFNGAAAEACFKRHCAALLRDPVVVSRACFQRLPSTSPAHASLRFEQKLVAWRAVMALDPPPRQDGVGKTRSEISQTTTAAVNPSVE
jgi:double-stranded uracil-DNA glycosylase